MDIDEDVVVELGLGRGVADRGIVQRERLPEKGATGSCVVFRVVAGRLVEAVASGAATSEIAWNSEYSRMVRDSSVKAEPAVPSGMAIGTPLLVCW